MNYNLLKSRTFWTIIAMFVIGGLNGIMPIVPANIQTIVMFALGALASYFHLQTGNSQSGTN